MKNFTFFFVFFLVAFLSVATMAQVPPAGLQLWLKADAGVTLNGSTVSQWTDQSGNGNNALQSNSDRQPMFVDNELNNKPILSFDGFNDRLGLTGTDSMSQITLFIVQKIESGATGPNPYYTITLGNTYNDGNIYGLSMRNDFSGNSPDVIDPFTGISSWVTAVATNCAAFDQWKIISVTTNETMWNTKLRANGVDAIIYPEGIVDLPISVPLGNSTGTGVGGIGGADSIEIGSAIFKGEIAEVVVYDKVLSDSERLAVENYLADKYNISNTSIPTAGLQLWLKADEGVILNGSTVSQWVDQSGNGNNALQSNSDRQPMFVDNELNNKPVLHFDGVNDRLSLYGSSTMSQISLFLVFKIDSGLVGNVGTDPLPYYPILLDGYGLSMRNFFSSNSPNIIDPFDDLESWVDAEAPNIAAFNQWKVLNVVTNQTMWNTTVRSNGVEAVITPQGTSSVPLSVSLGRPDGSDGIGGADNVPAGHLIFKGDIAEVVVYDTVLSDSDRLAVENYLSDKYAVILGVDDQSNGIPSQFILEQNYPNPFNPSTTIRFQVPNSSFVNLKVYDVLGREVTTLVNEEKPVGSYEINFDANGLSSGIYFYKLQSGSFVETKKMLLVK